MSKWIVDIHGDIEGDYEIIKEYEEPKIGYWIDTGSGQECSKCGEIQYGYDSFRTYCANCGSKNMEVKK